MSLAVSLSQVSTCLPPNGDGLAVVVDLPALLTLRPHEVNQGVQEHLYPGNHLISQYLCRHILTSVSCLFFLDLRIELIF